MKLYENHLKNSDNFEDCLLIDTASDLIDANAFLIINANPNEIFRT